MPFVDGAETRAFYEQFGDGPDVVFVSGGGSRGADWHPFQVPHFERSFRCTTYDCRGVGETACELPLPWPVSSFSLDLEDLVVRQKEQPDPPIAAISTIHGSLQWSALLRGRVVTDERIDHPVIHFTRPQAAKEVEASPEKKQSW
ncbi:MAG: hypothetical protein ABI572_09190, partial [Actinomycetota bacterium]